MSDHEPIEPDDEESYYEVERIVAVSVEEGRKMFLIKWKTYDESYNTWEPEDNLCCPEILENFWKGRELLKEKIEKEQKMQLNELRKQEKGKRRNDSKKAKRRKKSSMEAARKPPEIKASAAVGNEHNKPKHTTGLLSSNKVSVTQPAAASSSSSSSKSTSISGTNYNPSPVKTMSTASFKTASMKTKEKRPPMKPQILDEDDTEDDLGTGNHRLTKRPRLNEIKPPTMQPPAIAHRVLQPTIDIDSLVKTAKATLQPVSPTPKLLLKKPFTSPNLITALKANPKTPSPIIRSAAPDTATAAPKDMTLPQQQQIVRRQSPTPEFTTPPSSPSQIQRRESPPAVEAATKTFTTPSTLSTTTGPAAIVTNTNTNDNSNTAANIPTTTTTLTTTTSTTTTTISNPASSSSSSLANNPTPESTVADNSLAPSTQSIQLVRTHSPRSDPRLAHLSKPVNYDAIIEYKKHFAKVRLEGTLNRDGDYKIRDFMQLFKNNENQTIMRIASFIPMHVLESFLKKKVSPPALKVLPLEGGSVAISKLKGVLLGNNTAGSISHIRKPTEALMIMNQVQVDKLLDKPISTSTDKQSTGISHWPLYMVFIEGLPLRPGAVLAKLQHMPHHVDRKQLLQTYAWSKVSYLLKFPDKLHQAKQNKSNIVVYGHSENSNLLRLSIETLEIPIPASSHVMMFDRFNAEVFRKALFKHKKKGTQIWEFGSSEKSFKIEPATELFPPFSGGFITTDIKNIVHNPSIINTICDQVEKLNLTPGLTGSWKFLVPMNIFAQLKTAIRDSETSQNIQVAVANLTIGLSKNQIDAIRLWPAETSRPTHFMDQVARNFCKTRQYFIYVDDKDSVPEMERQMYPAVDFFTSKEIYKRLYTEE